MKDLFGDDTVPNITADARKRADTVINHWQEMVSKGERRVGGHWNGEILNPLANREHDALWEHGDGDAVSHLVAQKIKSNPEIAKLAIHPDVKRYVSYSLLDLANASLSVEENEITGSAAPTAARSKTIAPASLGVDRPAIKNGLSNPPSADPVQLLAMSRDDYDLAQRAYFKEHKRYAGSLGGMLTNYAHEVRDTLERRSKDLSAKEICEVFASFHPLAHEDSESHLRVGLHYALDERPEIEKTPDIKAIIDSIVNTPAEAFAVLEKMTGTNGILTGARAAMVEDGKIYVGSVVSNNGAVLVQDLGRKSLVVHQLDKLNQAPAAGSTVRIEYSGGRGQVSEAKMLRQGNER